ILAVVASRRAAALADILAVVARGRAAALLHRQAAGEPAERPDRAVALLGVEHAVVVAIEALEQELAKLSARAVCRAARIRIRRTVGRAGGIRVRDAAEAQRGHDCKGCELHAPLTRHREKR